MPAPHPGGGGGLPPGYGAAPIHSHGGGGLFHEFTNIFAHPLRPSGLLGAPATVAENIWSNHYGPGRLFEHDLPHTARVLAQSTVGLFQMGRMGIIDPYWNLVRHGHPYYHGLGTRMDREIARQIRSLKYTYQNPGADPVQTFLVVGLPFLHAGGEAADYAVAGRLSRAERMLMRPGGEGQPVYLRASRNLGLKAIQLAHDRLIQRAMYRNPEGILAGYGAGRMRVAITTQRYSARIRAAMAQDLRASVREVTRELRNVGAEPISKAEARATAMMALRTVREKGWAEERASQHRDWAAQEAAAGLPNEMNATVARLYQRVNDLGMTHWVEGGVPQIDAAKFPALADLYDRLATHSTKFDELLRRYGWMTMEGQRIRAGGPNIVYETGRELPEPLVKHADWRAAEVRVERASKALSTLQDKEEDWLAGKGQKTVGGYPVAPGPGLTLGGKETGLRFKEHSPFRDRIVRAAQRLEDAQAQVATYERNAGVIPKTVAEGRTALYEAMQQHPNVTQDEALALITYLDQAARKAGARTGEDMNAFYSRRIKSVATGEADLIPASALHELAATQYPFDEAKARAAAKRILAETPKDKADQKAYLRTVPPGARTVEGLTNLIRELHTRAVVAQAARLWYELRAQGYLDWSPSTEAAARLNRTESIYSPNRKVVESTGYAARAANENLATGQVTFGNVKARQPQKAMTALQGEGGGALVSSGAKTPSYDVASLEHIDPVLYREALAQLGIDPGREVVNDRWMRRAFKYKKGPRDARGNPNETVTPKMDRFMTAVQHHLADEQLGWHPKQVQAAIWTHIKAEIESGRTPTPEDLARAGMNPADFLAQHSAQIYFEAKHPMLPPEAANWSPETQGRYLQGKLALLYDEQGRNRILVALGVYGRRGSLGLGEWEGALTPSAGTQVLSTRISQAEAGTATAAERPYEIAANDRQIVEEVAAAHGYVFNQDAVGYAQVFSDTALTRDRTRANAVAIEAPLGDVEWRALRANGLTEDALIQHTPGNGTVISNQGDGPNPAFQDHVREVVRATLGPDVQTYLAAHDGDLVYRRDYAGRLAGATRRQPDLAGTLAELRGRLDAFDRTFAQEEAATGAAEHPGGPAGGGAGYPGEPRGPGGLGAAEAPQGAFSFGPRGDFTPPEMLYHEVRPLYHGTSRAFVQFSPDYFDPHALYGPGVYLTDSPEVASGYAIAGGVTHHEPYSTLAEAEARAAELHAQGIWNTVTPDKTYDFNGNPIHQWVVAHSEGHTPNVRVVTANVEKPFDVRAMIPAQEAEWLMRLSSSTELHKWADELFQLGDKAAPFNGQELYQILAEHLHVTGANRVLQEAGYDAIKHTGGTITGGAEHEVTVMLDPSKVEDYYPGLLPGLSHTEAGRIIGAYHPETAAMHFTPESTAQTFWHEAFHAIRQDLPEVMQRALLRHYGSDVWDRPTEEAFVQDMLRARAGEKVAPFLQRAYRSLTQHEEGEGYLSYRATEKGPSGMARVTGQKIIKSPGPSPVLAGDYRGIGTTRGEVPLDVVHDLANQFDRITRAVQIADMRNAWARTGSKDWQSSFDVLMREAPITYQTPSGEIYHHYKPTEDVPREMQNILEGVRSTVQRLPGSEMDHEVGFIGGLKAIIGDMIPSFLSPEWQRYEQSLRGQEAPGGFVWVDSRVMGNLGRFVREDREGLFGKLVRGVDAVNTAITAATVYLRVGHVPTRFFTNAMTNLIQGSLNPFVIARSVRLWWKLNDTERLRVANAAGVEYYRSLPTRGDTALAGATRMMAGQYARFIDQMFRVNSLMYEASKVGITTPEALMRLVNIVEDPAAAAPGLSPAALHEAQMVLENADRAAIAYGNLGENERDIAARTIWFYPWLKGSLTFAKDTMFEHPYKTAYLMNLGNVYAQRQMQQLGPLPSYEAGLFQVGPATATQGPLVSNLSTFSPFSTATDVLNLASGRTPIAGYFNPAAGALLAAAQQQNQFGAPLRHPGLARDIGNFLQQLVASTPESQIISGLHPPADQSRRMFPSGPYSAVLRYFFGPSMPRRINLMQARKDYLREIKGG